MAASPADARPRIVALIVAGGRGARAGSGIPKQYRRLGDRELLRLTVWAFAQHEAIDAIAVVIHPADRALYDASVAGTPKMLAPASGGNTRQESVLRGLQALDPAGFDTVLIHDAARPFVSADLISRIIDQCARTGAAVPGLPATDTLKRVRDGRISATVSRSEVFAVQTPQAFRLDAILAAHLKAQGVGRSDLTDDAAVAEFAGLAVGVIEGDAANIKITTAEDFDKAESMLTARMETRTAQGFDVHAFCPGDGVWLCGVRIPHDRSLLGHSDADVGIHALTDALLGTIGEGDIGQHFPPSDPQWKDASSDRFLADAVRRVRERGGRIVNLDVTLVCEAPKIGPVREAMRQAIATVAQVDVSRVSVKATTSERLGFTGRGEGIAAFAVATVQLPGEP
jgi:2-C-methyl-D-erythritol 4-phosphate cytidylyltransferase/2-C-methyl-D-erythritol 2,4-cyclodiphosphate synthase